MDPTLCYTQIHPPTECVGCYIIGEGEETITQARHDLESKSVVQEHALPGNIWLQ